MSVDIFELLSLFFQVFRAISKEPIFNILLELLGGVHFGVNQSVKNSKNVVFFKSILKRNQAVSVFLAGKIFKNARFSIVFFFGLD